MSDAPDVQEFSRHRLRGEPLPSDLAIIFANRAALFERAGVMLLPDPNWEPWADTSYLSAADLANPDIAANVAAIAEVSKFISFVGASEDSEYFGYWRSLAKRTVADSPVVCLNNEGRFELCRGRTFADAIVARYVFDADSFADWASWLTSLGVEVAYDSVDSMPEPVDEATPQMLHQKLYFQVLGG